MTLPRLLPFVSVHTESGIKLVLALIGPVVTTLLGHWRLTALRRTRATAVPSSAAVHSRPAIQERLHS